MVAGAVIAGFFDAVGVVAAAFDDAGVAALAAVNQVLAAGDSGDQAGEGALAVLRGKRPGQRPGGG